MTVSNDFLQRAIIGLEQGDVWITRGIGIQKKDYLPVRVLKSWARGTASFFETSFCGHSIYSDIQVDLVLSDLRYANWAGVDPQKAKIFFELFERAVKGRHSVDTTSLVDFAEASKVVEKKIEEDTFAQNWSRREDGLKILTAIPQSRVYVTVDDRNFSVESDRLSRSYVCDDCQEGLARITPYENGNVTLLLFSHTPLSLNANMVERILLKVYEEIAARKRIGSKAVLTLLGPSHY